MEESNREEIAVSVWALNGKSTMVGAGIENQSCDSSKIVCAGFESRVHNPGYSSFGRPIDQAFMVAEAQRNGGLHPAFLVKQQNKPPEFNIGPHRIFPWQGRVADPTILAQPLHKTYNETHAGRLFSRYDSRQCLTFNATTMVPTFALCHGKRDHKVQWWLEDDKEGRFKTKAQDEDGKALCMTRKADHHPDVVVMPCESAPYPLWFTQFGFIKNKHQPFDYEECLGWHFGTNEVAIYPCEWAVWQEFYFEGSTTNRWSFKTPRTYAVDRRRNYKVL
jgi:hypothetical protein